MKIAARITPNDFGDTTRQHLAASPARDAVKENVWRPVRWLWDLRDRTRPPQLFLAPGDKGV